MRPMRRLRAPEAVEVLDEEAWEVPASLNEDDWRGMAPDGRRDGREEREDEAW